MKAYCLKCKVKRDIKDPIAGFNKRGVPVTRGICPVCGSGLYRTGRTEAHDGLKPPVIKRKDFRSGKLVIVESPAKARTVENILGNGYKVRASVGHVRDLLRSQLSVDVDNNFTPKYRVPNDKKLIVKELKADVKKASEVFLATDPDREGEAIAWHLKETTEIEPKRLNRVVFHEITKPAIESAFSNPHSIDMNLVKAQQARRILDRLVGYNLSPLLWRKVRGHLSAGRVQSVALRLIVEREREIESFVPKEFWTIDAKLQPEASHEIFIARLIKLNSKEPELPTEGVIHVVLNDMEMARYVVEKIKRGKRRRGPYAPFITSTLQQQASRKLGFRARKTMMLAQQLYEGVDIGNGGATGLITYMRTDSTRISPVALEEVRGYILKRFGEKFLPAKPIKHRTRAVVAQEAHEAIRPTSILPIPENLKSYLKRDQFRLYQLIWKRFVASQMETAIYSTVSVDVCARSERNNYLLRASGSHLQFSGFLILYEEAQDNNGKKEKEKREFKIPENLTEGQKQKLLQLLPDQHFTQPPPRFTEASLVQILEEYGIGRPSTYAPILSTIYIRGYVERDGKRLIPTETGFLVNDLLIEFFPNVLGVNFTANMEEDLDEVALGKREWTDVLHEFYQSFEPKLVHAQEVMPESKVKPEKTGEICPKCGHDLVIRWGRYGKFISCSNFPECRYTEPLLKKIGVKCPKDGGDIVIRKTRRGRIFYGCENYPKCDFTSWKKPIRNKCPDCGGMLVVKNKNEAQCLTCKKTFSLEKLSLDEKAA